LVSKITEKKIENTNTPQKKGVTAKKLNLLNNLLFGSLIL